jgi:Zn-dependent peptidase ImmA (M78 family)/transcriptional regulator with XRE-family HTH domain
MSHLGEVLTTARRASGKTQGELADIVGITQAALSRYENSLREPDEVTLDKLARELGVTSKFIHHAGRVRGAMAVDAHMRRRGTAQPTVWKRLEARLNMYRMHASLLSEEVRVRSAQRIPTFDPIDVPAADAARLVRMQWGMPVGPVRNLVGWIESAGCLVIEEDFGTTRVDGMSQWVNDTPLIFINSAVPTDRKRLTLAHELGHLTLHSTEVTEDVEEQANAFAAELLMPLEMIRPQLRGLRVDRLFDLKREWGVSMAALTERAFRAGLLNQTQRTSMYKILSARGWRTREPVSDELIPEHPLLTREIAKALADRGLTAHEVATIAGFASADDNHLLPTAHGALRLA